MIFKSKKGFTLIELLVVVAIIGILSSIVLVSLNSARNKGRDASAKGSMSSMRAAAELYYDSRGNYGANTGSDVVAQSEPLNVPVATAADICEYTEIVNLSVAANKQTGTDILCRVIGSPSASYTVHALMNDNKTYCIDSKGYAGYTVGTAPVTAGASCI